MTDRSQTISFVFGTRPEAIKLCPLVLALRRSSLLRPHVCLTGQHREMVSQVLPVFDVTADVDLGLMQPDQTLAGLTARMVAALDEYLRQSRPAMVLVQGDTTTALCASLAAFYHRIPVGHVEAGLRTGDKWAPFPEEMNRVLTSRLADWHFAPTEAARENLLREAVPAERIHVTGNTVIDALEIALAKAEAEPPAIPALPAALQPGAAGPCPRLVLITGHRRESFGPGFERICRAIAVLARNYSAVEFVYPVHLNPNVRGPVHQILGAEGLANVRLIEPLAYLPFVALMNRATLILTDSGGIQEEAPSLAKPVLVMREVTERPEALASGTVALVGTAVEAIVDAVSRLLDDPAHYASMARRATPYGDGRACARILAVLEGALR